LWALSLAELTPNIIESVREHKLKPRKRNSGVTLRSIIITVILVPLNYYWVIVGETEMGGGTYMLPSLVVPFYNVVFCLFIVICLKFLLEKLLKVSLLSQGELLTIYILLSSACALCSVNMMTALMETLGHASWFATPENEWEDLFIRYLPNWLSVQDKHILRGYYEGESTLYEPEHIKSWLAPALNWSAFVFALVLVMLCINAILRKQWTERERLSYPIIKLPLGITSAEDNFFASKLTWIGFAVAGTITMMNALSFLYPSIPSIPIHRRGIGHLFTEKPMSAIRTGGFNLSFYPFALGFSFLMPLELAFSCWFFYLVGKLELIFNSITGWNPLGGIPGWSSAPEFPYGVERAFGASASLIIFMLWNGRRHLKDVILRILGRWPVEDSHEAMPYRSAVLGIILGLGFLVIFSGRIGIPIWVAIVFFAIYFALSVMLTRVRVELGLFTHPMRGMMAPEILITFTGTRALGTEALTAISLFRWFNFGFPNHPMPHQLEGLKLSERAGINNRKMAIGIMAITAFGALGMFWVFLHIFYKVGALSGGGWARGGGRHAFEPLQSWISNPREPNYPSILFMGVSFVFSTFLSVMRLRFIWWMFHPIGYMVANLQWAMRNFWNCMLIGSIAKWLILKYSGPKGHQQAVKICIGLILGDFVIGGLWNVIGIVLNIPTYSFWPGAKLP